MIKTQIDRLVATYPAELALVQNVVDVLMPYALLALLFWLVWQALCAFDRWLERSEARRVAKAREPQFRTADAKQLARDIDQLWRRAPPASGPSWEPWHDTVPPAEPAHPKTRTGNVMAFRRAGQERQS